MLSVQIIERNNTSISTIIYQCKTLAQSTSSVLQTAHGVSTLLGSVSLDDSHVEGLFPEPASNSDFPSKLWNVNFWEFGLPHYQVLFLS